MYITPRNFRIGILASALAVSATACSDRDMVNKVKDEALSEVSDVNRFDAERSGAYYSALGTNPELAAKVLYWDSITINHKTKCAYEDGKEYAVKRHNGEEVDPKTYSVDFMSRNMELNGQAILNNLRFLGSQGVSAGNWLKLRKNEPDMLENSASTPAEIMYWKHITNARKLKKAFMNGVQFAKDSIANSKEQVLIPKSKKQNAVNGSMNRVRFVRTLIKD